LPATGTGTATTCALSALSRGPVARMIAAGGAAGSATALEPFASGDPNPLSAAPDRAGTAGYRPDRTGSRRIGSGCSIAASPGAGPPRSPGPIAVGTGLCAGGMMRAGPLAWPSALGGDARPGSMTCPGSAGGVPASGITATASAVTGSAGCAAGDAMPVPAPVGGAARSFPDRSVPERSADPATGAAGTSAPGKDKRPFSTLAGTTGTGIVEARAAVRKGLAALPRYSICARRVASAAVAGHATLASCGGSGSPEGALTPTPGAAATGARAV
jgi:hypothetical protein